MVMWRKDLDPYVSVNTPHTSAFLSVTVDIPGFITMVHIAVYLPTAGKDSEFLTELASLRIYIEKLQHEHPTSAILIYGDCNSSRKNKSRHIIFSKFCSDLNLTRVQLHHDTYHHFMGQGMSDSELDVILHSNSPGIHEELLTIFCKHENDKVDSHHDLLLSQTTVPVRPVVVPPDKSRNIVAPKLDHTRHRIVWTEDSQLEYECLVSSHLSRIRDTWLNTSSKASISVLLQATNMILTQSASSLNKTVDLSSKHSPKSLIIPPSIRRSNESLARSAKKLRRQLMDGRYSKEIVEESRAKYKFKKAEHRKAVRKKRTEESMRRDKLSSSILSDNPRKLYQAVRAATKSSNDVIKKLFVDDKVYEGDEVCDGFYDNISFLKTEAHNDLNLSANYVGADEEYKNILKLCKQGLKVPSISLEETRKILYSIRPAVSDYASITAQHYRHAGEAGVEHLQFLINALIEDVDNLSVDELNLASACILHKSHGKDKSFADSYRTISSCPFLSKALDTYIGDIYGHIWEQHQAPTQFQGKGSSHDLAALLLTETIQSSLQAGNPIFVLYLDAKSAFDLVIRQYVTNKLYHYGIQDQGLFVIDQRLKNRKTICEWNGKYMGPIHDKWGVEQGGKNSSDFYKVYNNSQLQIAQDSLLGVDLGGNGDEDLTVSAIGQADDVALVSNDIFSLKCLLQLSLQYCDRHHVKLRADKTKLQAYSCKNSDTKAYYAKVINPIRIKDKVIQFSDEAEHVGLVRSTAGNVPHISSRFTAHKKSLASVLPFGLARSHRCNPAASLRINNLYATPVLLSGLGSLILSSSEINMINMYMKRTTQNLQKLMAKTPACVVAFLGGTLPGTAVLHLKQLGIFCMVTRMKGSLLWKHALNVLSTARPKANSWFQHIRSLCSSYQLPHPILLLQEFLPKTKLNRLVKSKVINYWELKLREEASNLKSLRYFKPEFMSLTNPHPIWTSCNANPWQVHKAVTACRMLSGRYLTDQLQRHWTHNKAGMCLLPLCLSPSEGSLEHILLHCTSLHSVHQKMYNLCHKVSQESEELSTIINTIILSGDQLLVQLILDCTVLPDVIKTTATCGTYTRDRLLYIGRTWCHSIHSERMNQLGLFEFK